MSREELSNFVYAVEHSLSLREELRNYINPLILKMYSVDKKPVVLSEQEGTSTEIGTTKEFSSKIGVTFYPWLPLAGTREIPCSADWVVTIVEPQEHVVKLYQEKVNGRTNSNVDQDSVIAE